MRLCSLFKALYDNNNMMIIIINNNKMIISPKSSGRVAESRKSEKQLEPKSVEISRKPGEDIRILT